MAFGLSLGLVAVEIGLRLVPEDTWKVLVARHPIRYKLYRSDPDVGWRLKSNATTRYRADNEFDVQIRTNSHGLNDFEHAYEKSPGTFRILLLGDSFAESINVPITEGFPYLLETCLNKHYQHPVEVINSGTSYYSSAEELFYLQQEGWRYNPDLVLVAFYIGNDIDAFEARKVEDGWFDTFGGYLIELDGTGQLKKAWIDWEHPSPYEPVSALELLLRRNSRIYYILAHSESKVAKWLDGYLDEYREKIKDARAGNWFTSLIASLLIEATTPSASPQERIKDSFKNDLNLMRYAPDFPDGAGVPPQLREDWAIINQVFNQIKTNTDTMEAKLGVIIIPELSQASEQYYEESRKRYSALYGSEIAKIAWNYAAPNQAFSILLTEKNIPNLDLLPIYRADDAAHDRLLYFPRNRHLNQAGHQITAQAACQWVIDNHFGG